MASTGLGFDLEFLTSRKDKVEEGEIPLLYPVGVEYSTPSATVSIKNMISFYHSLESGCIFKNLI
jgi:hypothetical protein